MTPNFQAKYLAWCRIQRDCAAAGLKRVAGGDGAPATDGTVSRLDRLIAKMEGERV